MGKSPSQTWTARALRASAFLWTLAAGAVLGLLAVRDSVITGLEMASAQRSVDPVPVLLPPFLVFAGAFAALTLLTGILWVAQRRTKQEPSALSGVIA